MTEDLKAAIAATVKRAFLLTHAHLGRDLTDEEITALVTAVVKSFGFNVGGETVH